VEPRGVQQEPRAAIEVAEVFFQRVLERAKPYLSDERFTVDGALIEAWASHKTFRPKGRRTAFCEGARSGFSRKESE
jgi:hypothetical protein